MGLLDKMRGEFIDIIEWTDDSRDTIVWRFPRYNNEIKMGAQLVVRESQVAVFVNEGQVADTFTPGTYTLETKNLPILSTLKGWKYGFASPFKAEVYFVTTRQFTDLKWGTQNPAMLRDPEFGMVRVRAFGAFTLQVVDAAALLRELAGTDPMFRTEEVVEFLRQNVVSRFVTALAAMNIAALDIASRQQELARTIGSVLTEDLASLGVAVPRFVIENVSLPPEVEKAIDTRTRMGVLGDLNQYTRMQAADAITLAAENPGGVAGAGLGAGLGLGLGNQMAGALNQANQPGQATAGPAGPGGAASGPPPLPNAASWYVGVNGHQQGPFTPDQLAGQLAAGTVRASTLVWSAGMAAWAELSSVPQLAGLLEQTPPPLPPQ